MSHNYKGEAPTEDGTYLVRAEGELHVAQYYASSKTWYQIGEDYDSWYSGYYGNAKLELEVISKLDLEALAELLVRAKTSAPSLVDHINGKKEP